MALKCVRCGGSFFTRGRIRLADADICFKCFDELGFDHKTGIYTGKTYKWDEIKDGFDAMMAREHQEKKEIEAEERGLTVKQLKQLGDAEATEMETKILAVICALLDDEGRDPDVIEAALGTNGSLLLMIDGTVFIEYKAEPNVKWICFCNEGEEKIRIAGPGRMNAFAPRIVQAYDSVPV